MSEVAIQVENLSKEFKIGSPISSDRHLREVLIESISSPFRKFRRLTRGDAMGAAGLEQSFWALQDVSFRINHGEVVGLIGKNGAGKSTLLKILSRITGPSKGRVTLHGRIGSLLEVGIGFNHELSGRENIYLSGAINGMRKGEIDRQFDEIVEFSEIGRFLDTPVKHYSSGMYLRLAFSVAAHLDPEILLVDEVLAVGDLSFQRKCLGKMGDVAKRGRTVILVSHNMGAIAELCTEAIWLQGGRLVKKGPSGDVITEYLHSSADTMGKWERPRSMAKSKNVSILSARVLQEDKHLGRVLGFEDNISVEVEYEVMKAADGCYVGIALKNGEGYTILESRERDSMPRQMMNRSKGRYRATCQIPGGLLRQGQYYVTLGSLQNIGGWIERVEDALSFEVSEINNPGTDRRKGVINPILNWAVSLEEELPANSSTFAS